MPVAIRGQQGAGSCIGQLLVHCHQLGWSDCFHWRHTCTETICTLQAGGTERVWNWKDPAPGIEATLTARGRRYNGYPVSAGYFGAFSIDGLAIALHCVYTTTSFNEAVSPRNLIRLASARCQWKSACCHRTLWKTQVVVF